jgi:hypothetical protein
MITRVTVRTVAVALAITLGSTLAVAAPTVHDAKKAECTREAKARHSGIHFIKRARFIKNCMAR